MGFYVTRIGPDGQPVSNSERMEQLARDVRREMDWDAPIDDVVNDAIRSLRIARDRIGLARDEACTAPDFDTQEESLAWQRYKATELANEMARLCPDLLTFRDIPEVCSIVLRAYERAGIDPEPAPAKATPKPKYPRREVSASTRLAVYKRDGYACKHCGTHEDLSIDHIFPVSKGGTNDLENLQTLCRPCNSRKGARVEEGESE